MPSPLIIIAGPTGAGKTTVAEILLKRKKIALKRFTSCTTRIMRPTEKNHREYHFLSVKDFEQEIKNKNFLEWAKSFETYYGNRVQDIEQAFLNKVPSLFVMGDIKGIRKLKKLFPNTIIIYLKSDLSELKDRIKGRKFTKKQTALRLNKMKADMKAAKLADLVILNKQGKLTETVRLIELGLPAIIKQKPKKSARS